MEAMNYVSEYNCDISIIIYKNIYTEYLLHEHKSTFYFLTSLGIF